MGYKTIGLLAIIIQFGGCGPKEPAIQVFASPEEFKVGLGKLYERYLIVQSGLIEENPTMSLNALSAMLGGLHEIHSDGLDSSAKAYWDSGTASIMLILHRPGLMTGGLADVRMAIKEVTPMLLDWLDRFGFRSQEKVFVFSCPDAGDFKDAIWLQSALKPRNPYLGASGRTCGSRVREVMAYR